MEKSKNLNIRIDKKLYDTLKQKADLESRTVSKVVRTLIEKYIKEDIKL